MHPRERRNLHKPEQKIELGRVYSCRLDRSDRTCTASHYPVSERRIQPTVKSDFMLTACTKMTTRQRQGIPTSDYKNLLHFPCRRIALFFIISANTVWNVAVERQPGTSQCRVCIKRGMNNKGCLRLYLRPFESAFKLVLRL